jgi:hypothetical protein
MQIENPSARGSADDGLTDALVEIERALNISPPIGAQELPPATRFRAVLIELRSRICPKQEAIAARIESDGVSVAVVIADTLITTLSQIPLPVATVAKHISKIGLAQFCKQPSSVFHSA